MRPLTDATPKPLLRGARQAADRTSPRALARRPESSGSSSIWRGSADRSASIWETARATASRIDYSEEAPQALETGGGIFRALPRLGPAPSWSSTAISTPTFPFETLGIALRRTMRIWCWCRIRRSYPSGDFGLETGWHWPAPPTGTPSPASPCIVRSSSPAASDGVFPLEAAPGCGPWRPTGARPSSTRGSWEDVGTPERLRPECGDPQSRPADSGIGAIAGIGRIRRNRTDRRSGAARNT